ncbi:MAG TPA: Calx-beta domain-containing protein [Opitutaceae bacterium]|nr:Calx-beta domain-containing protein [Opitutaceae bacterium]
MNRTLRPLALGLVALALGIAYNLSGHRAPPPAGATSLAVRPPDPPGRPAPARDSPDATAPSAPPAPVNELARFDAWLARFLASPEADRAALLGEGRQLAAARRAVLARLIREDPRAALATAVPMVTRQALPPEIVALLEERVSGRGTLATVAVTPLPHQRPERAVFRSIVIGDREYDAHVFGRRAPLATVEKTSVHGIAIDGDFAVAESPLRVLEPGEKAMGRPVSEICGISGAASAPAGPDTPLNVGEATAVEYNGTIHVLCGPRHAPAMEERLKAEEETPATSAAAAGPGTSHVVGRPSEAWTHGQKRLLIIRVDFPDKPGTPINTPDGQPLTDAKVAALINGSQGVRDFFTANSYGRSTIALAAPVSGDSTDVTPVYRMPQPTTHYAPTGEGMLLNDAVNAARAGGVNVDGYDRVGLVFSSLPYWWGGLGNIMGRYFWINGYFDLRVVAHEIGHTYGVIHSNWWRGTTEDPLTPSGYSEEYGDAMDIMGNGNAFNYHFSHWHKSVLRWIPDSAVTTAAASGVFRVHRLDAGDGNLALPRAVKITRDAEREFWIGYRADMPLGTAPNGAYVLWGYNIIRSGDLLNLSRATSGSSYEAPLPIGASFTDAVSGVALQPLALGGSGADQWMDVRLTFPAMVGWARPEWGAAEVDGSVTVRLSRTRDGTQPVTLNWSTSDGTALAGADYAARSGTISWAAGDMSDKFVTIPVTADSVTEGVEWFVVSMTAVNGAQMSGEAQANIFIGETGARDRSYFAEFPAYGVRSLVALPDGGSVVGGLFETGSWQSLPYFRHGFVSLSPDGAVDTAYGNGAGAPNTVFDLARQPDGAIVLGGNFSTVHGTARRNLARLLPDGSVDPSFQADTNGVVWTVLAEPDGSTLAGGRFTQVNGADRARLVRLRADGSVDPEFVGPLFDGTTAFIAALALQPDGRLLVGGAFSLSAEGPMNSLVRLNPDGTIDATFRGLGAQTPASSGSGGMEAGSVRAIAVQPDGRILVGGVFSHYNGVARRGLVRLMPNGDVDPSFTTDTDGYVLSVAPLPGGRWAVGGGFATIGGAAIRNLAFLASTGAVEAGPAEEFPGEAADLALAPSGRLYLGGEATYGTQRSAVWRIYTGTAGPPTILSFAMALASGREGEEIVVNVTRTGSLQGAVAVGYATAPGTATASDFQPVRGIVSWAAGDGAAKTVRVPLRQDAVDDPAEMFFLQLGSPVVGAAVLGPIQRMTLTVQPGPTQPPPEGDWAAGDVGPTGLAGSTTEEGTRTTVRGSGADIWGTADGFHFRALRLEGDGTIVARVASVTNTHAWAKAGLMFREDLTAGSRNVFAYVTPGNHAGLQSRAAPGGASAVTSDVLATMPQWLRLVRAGNSFSAFRSLNGVDWIALGTTTLALPPVLHVGLAVTSHNNSLLASAVFEHVQVVPAEPPSAPPAAPSGLHSTAVGGSAVTLAWTDNSTNETAFAVERAPGTSASFAEVGRTAANTTTFTDSAVAPSTTYTYRVRAVAGALFSNYTNAHAVTTTATPEAWRGADIGNVGLAGDETFGSSSATVRAAGADIWGAADGFRYVYQPWRGDGEIVARITRLDPTHSWAKAGVMFRESLEAGARNVMCLLTAGNAAGLQVRAATGGATTFAAGPRLAVPHWVRLVRAGDTFSAFTSTDGVNWTARGSQTVPMQADILVGLAVTSHTTSARTTAVFEQVRLDGGVPPPPAWTQTNWGGGQGTFTAEDQAMTVAARGADIWGAADDGVFVNRTVGVDGAMTVRIDSLTNTHAFAKAGVMVRGGTAANAANVFLAVTPSAGVTFQARSTPGGGTVELRRGWGVTAPVWLRLARTGDQFTAQYSTNGTAWTSLGTQVVALPRAAQAGVAVSSHAAASTTATMSNLTLPEP